MLCDFQTERWTELAQGKGGDAMVWSHDSRFVYLNIKHGSPPSEVFRISIPDGKIERVLDLRDKTLGGIWDGWTSLLPDDSLLLMFAKGTSDIHRLDNPVPLIQRGGDALAYIFLLLSGFSGFPRQRKD